MLNPSFPNSSRGHLDANARIKHLHQLAKVGWLAEQPKRFQEDISAMGRWVEYSAGTRIYSAGDPSDELIGVGSGLLDVLVSLSNDEECVFYRAGSGSWLGDGGLLFGEPRQLSLETAADSRLFVVPQSRLRRHLAAQGGDWRYLFHLATNRMTMAADLVGSLISLPPQTRIARQLLRLRQDDTVIVSKQEDLAKLVGMSRATFTRTVRQLVSMGAIETRYGKFTIVDVEKLKVIAEIP